MRNLSLWNLSLNYLQFRADDCFCYHHNEATGGELFTCSQNLIVSNFTFNGEIKWYIDLKDVILRKNKPVNVIYISLLQTLSVGFENGEIVRISDSGDLCDVVGLCDAGLLAMEWSPEQELLILVTKNLTAILMSCTYDVINEVNLLSDEFGKRQFVTVGWGKKETQFHGSEGKQAAKVKNEVTADNLSQSDDSVKISWRGDGSLYAIGFNLDGIRRFKVFDREGHLLYTSEKQQGLESNIAWRPSGNVIATTQKVGDHYDIAFFEKNGLKHGGFHIPINNNTYVEDIAWSIDSDILTLQCRNMETNTQELLLFTTSNYHWYHKQTLIFKDHQRIKKIWWDHDFDITHNKTLHIFLQDGEYYCYTWVWDIDHSKGKSNNDDAVVAVIDGTKLLLTGFRQAIVPPPMSVTEITCDKPINSVHFAPSERNLNSNSFCIITADNKCIFYEQKNNRPLEYELKETIHLQENEFPFQYYNWNWFKMNTIICATLDGDRNYNLVEYSFDANTLHRTNFVQLPASVTRIQPHPSDFAIAFLQLNNGEIMTYYKGKTAEPQETCFPVACPKFDVIEIDEALYFLGLSHKQCLIVNDTKAMHSVTSYFISSHFLLITNTQHELLCSELTKKGIDAIIEFEKKEILDFYKRKMERGSKLVIAVPNDTRTIFQLPRGNLEAIQPRTMSLKIIGEYLDELKYHEAFDIMRKERINLNLIYDHDPEKFIANIDLFLESIYNTSWLSLFLSDLEDVDVTKTMYASSYADRTEKLTSNTRGKINMICDLVRERLTSSDIDRNILPVLTAYVKKNTVDDLEKALSLIKELKLRESNGAKLPVGTDEALKYLLYMVEVNHLFNVALGMYDFDLVLLVANKSQKDPKEFIPMLNELNVMDDNYKMFSINKHLKRYNKAVHSLVKCGPERYEELKTFVKYHSLYRDALDLFSVGEEIYKEIAYDYGNYLYLKKHYIEAGIFFERAENYEKAVDCYRHELEWEMALKLVHKKSPEQLKEMSEEFISALKSEKRHIEALKILQEYYNDDKRTILYAIECGEYKTAFRLCAQHDRLDFRDNFLIPAVLDDYKNLNDLIQNNLTTYCHHKDRLQIVREFKINHPVEVYDPYGYRDSDLYSDAGSTLASSRGSSRSFRSSKNRRKHERKMTSLREGSHYEDAALILALHSLVTSSFDLRGQVKNVNIALCSINKDKEALTLQTSLDKLLKVMKDSFKEIWTDDLVIQSTKAAAAAQNCTEGSVIPEAIAILEPHVRIAPVVQEISWKLEGLE